MKLLTLYAFLAILAIFANIGTQYLVVRVYSGTDAIAVSMLLGTAAGLILKYFLDKRYIFKFRANNLAHDGRTFIFYTCMGLVTTCIFWAIEYSFHHYFSGDEWRYFGGVLGLVVGYIVKYYLDKWYVFK